MILDERADELLKNAMFICLVLSIGSLTYSIYPLYLFVMKGEHLNLIPIILPFTDPETNRGYYINLANQVIIAATGIIGNYAIEIGFTVMTNNLWAASDVIKYDLNEIVLGIKRGETKEVRSAKLRNVFVQIQDVDM